MLSSFSSPESGTISGADYDSSSQQLTVHFNRGNNPGKSYTYQNVPADLWLDFTQAESKGKFFASAIRPMFGGTPA